MLVLFYFASCPFCQKVLSFCDENQIKLELSDIQKDPKAKQELIELGGKKQVPALKIGDKILYESDAIIEYLSMQKR